MKIDSHLDSNDPAGVPASNDDIPAGTSSPDFPASDRISSKSDREGEADNQSANDHELSQQSFNDNSQEATEQSTDPSDLPTHRSLVGKVGNARRKSLERLRERPPFSLNPEVIKLFYAIDALKADSGSFVLQFLAPSPGEGTTTISWGFSLAASYEYAEPTLIIDCNCKEKMSRRKLSLIDAFLETGYPENAIEKVPHFNRLYRARLSAENNSMLEIDGADLRKLFDQLKLSFSAIILDCPAANQASDSLALSRYADGSVLVIKSGHSRRGVVEWARDSLAQYGGLLLGAVFNQRKKYIPEWLYRRI